MFEPAIRRRTHGVSQLPCNTNARPSAVTQVSEYSTMSFPAEPAISPRVGNLEPNTKKPQCLGRPHATRSSSRASASVSRLSSAWNPPPHRKRRTQKSRISREPFGGGDEGQTGRTRCPIAADTCRASQQQGRVRERASCRGIGVNPLPNLCTHRRGTTSRQPRPRAIDTASVTLPPRPPQLPSRPSGSESQSLLVAPPHTFKSPPPPQRQSPAKSRIEQTVLRRLSGIPTLPGVRDTERRDPRVV